MNVQKAALVLWVVFLVSVLAYSCAAYVIPVKPAAFPVAILVNSLYVVAAILVISSVLIHRRLLCDDLVGKYASLPWSGRGIDPDSEDARQLTRHHAARWVLKVHIVAWAMADAVAVLGLVAALVTGRAPAILPFVVASVLLFLKFRPNFSAVGTAAPYSDPLR